MKSVPPASAGGSDTQWGVESWIHPLTQVVLTQNLSTRNIRPRLDDIDLAFHVSPFDVLILTVENPLDIFSGGGQTAHHFIGQHHALTTDRNFFDPTVLVEYQKAILFRSRQDLDRVGDRTVDTLLGDA